MNKEHEHKEGDATQAEDLTERLTRRLSAPGLVDLRQPRRQYERTALWAAERHPLLERLRSRRIEEDDAASPDSHVPGRMLFRSAARVEGASGVGHVSSVAAPTFARTFDTPEQAATRVPAVSREPSAPGTMRVRRKPAPKTSGGGQKHASTLRRESLPAEHHAPRVADTKDLTPHEASPAPREGRVSAEATNVARPIQRRAASDAALVLPKRQGSYASAVRGRDTQGTFNAPPLPSPPSPTPADRPSTERAATPREPHATQARDPHAKGSTKETTRDSNEQAPAVAFELRARSSLAPPPGVVWHRGSRRTQSDTTSADERSNAQTDAGHDGAQAHAPATPADTSGTQANPSVFNQEAQRHAELDAGRIAEQVMRDISRRLVVERERRGLGN